MEIIRSGKKIVVLENDSFDICGTCHQSEMVISYKDIVNKLGNPTSKGDDYKVSAEWEIWTPFGVGTIYDYKQSKKYCGKDGDNKKNITYWHIGGSNKETGDFIKSIFFK